MTGGEINVATIWGDRDPGMVSDHLALDRQMEPDRAQRPRLRHDIQHELATIGLLASLIGTSDDVGETSRARATQLVRETRWLAELIQAYEDLPAEEATPSWSVPAERLRVDILVGEVVAALRLTHGTSVQLETAEVWTIANRLGLWRALRNVLENALRAAGPKGRVHVRVQRDGAATVVQIDDDGPGLGAGPAGLASLGLVIVRDILAEHRGALAMTTSDLGGGSVRLLLPGPPPPERGDGWRQEDCGARTGL